MSTKIEYRKPGIYTLEFTCPYCKMLNLHESLIYQLDDLWRAPSEAKDFLSNHPIWYTFDANADKAKGLKYFFSFLVKNNIKRIVFAIRICSNCGGRSYFEKILFKDDEEKQENQEEIRLIYPFNSSIDIEPNDDMENEDKALFNEARDIFDRSPKASGALLRSVLESILRKHFSEKHSDHTLGKILKDQDVKDILGEDILKLCEAIKLVGNESSHSALLIYKDEDKRDVKLLFELINLVVDEIISKPTKKQKLLDNVDNVIKKQHK